MESLVLIIIGLVLLIVNITDIQLMHLPLTQSNAAEFTIHIKKEVEHLLSDPVFYTHNPPYITKTVLQTSVNSKPQQYSITNAACVTCINKDLHSKKLQQNQEIKRKDELRVQELKAKGVQKQQKQAAYKKSKQQNFRKGLDEHVKLHSQQKMKIKQRDLTQQQHIQSIMKSQILRVEEKERRQKKQRSLSQLSFKAGLQNQMKEKREQQQKIKESKQSESVSIIPKCIPIVSSHYSRNSLSNGKYRLDLDSMIKDKQLVRRNESKERMEKQRLRLLKVLEKQQAEESKLQVRKQVARKQEAEVMKQNIVQVKNKSEALKRVQKENQQPIKAFFDEQKRKQKQSEKRNKWKSELKQAMIESVQQSQNQSRAQSRRNSVRQFSNYRSKQKGGVSVGKTPGLKIIINDDKVCCSNCHEVKPAYAVGNYVFGK